MIDIGEWPAIRLAYMHSLDEWRYQKEIVATLEPLVRQDRPDPVIVVQFGRSQVGKKHREAMDFLARAGAEWLENLGVAADLPGE
jgi:hypothetical protein